MANKQPPIHIKASRRGTFTAAATEAGKSLSEEASDVLAPGSHASSALKAKANFYRNIVKQ
jgi:hypothetical protein